MLINVRVYQKQKRDPQPRYAAMENYAVPAGSWLQTETDCGMIHVAPVHQAELHDMGRGYVVALWPQSTVFIPDKLLKLVTGNDRTWGKNGIEWMGCQVDRQGGRLFDRALQYAVNYRDGMYGGRGRKAWGAYAERSDCPPVDLTDDEIAYLLGERVPPVREQLSLFDAGEANPVPARIREWEAQYL